MIEVKGGVALWRIAHTTARYSADDLSGTGAAIAGGRWNPVGVPVVYSASSIALATLEKAVHTASHMALVNAFLVMITVPRPCWARRTTIDEDDLPRHWDAIPPVAATAKLGGRWVDSHSSLLLDVPSAIVPEERNVLINPAHPDARLLGVQVIRPFGLDKRLQ